MMGMKAAATNGVRADSVALLRASARWAMSAACRPDGKGIRERS